MGANHSGGPSAEGVFKALGSPARLTIVRTLIEGERCVCDLVDAVGLGWSTTSRHLEVLREAGVVASEKRAQKIFYRLRLGCVADFIDCLDGACSATAESRIALRRLRSGT
ncbi:MAG TPA: metalloregulator ArsR/SmtB family transcription factor [Steroidobacteraceae bacterium]|nr:metalloregulator ArsR/SmtB family transcription factor [Steroidobacteraceae bacterium]